MVKQLGQLVLRQAEALNRLEYDTCFLLVLQTSPHPGTVIPSLFKVASGEAGALSQRPHTESEAGDFGVPGERTRSEGGHDRQHTRGQEAGRGNGPVGWGSLGLSDLGPKAATEPSRKPVPGDFRAQTSTMQQYILAEGLTRFQALKPLTEELSDTPVHQEGYHFNCHG